MASMNNLLISLNYDKVTGSNGSGQFLVVDTISTNNGNAVKFDANSTNFILKEELATEKKTHFENLDGSESISIRDSDDLRVSDLDKPTSMQVILENSMYQQISDDMINLFSTVDGYARLLIEPKNKYSKDYKARSTDKLSDARQKYFSKVLNKPYIEKYIEFYKWIDSSLSEMIQQLVPENSSVQKGLKITVEDHILDRSKFVHPLPLTISKNPVFSAGITVANTSGSLARTNQIKTRGSNSGTSRLLNKANYIEGKEDRGVNTKNIVNNNYQNNYEVFNTAGKIVNNRGNKTNKSVFQTKFSAGDGLSELNRDNSGEFSVYNETNQRAAIVRQAFNISQSADRRIDQGTNSTSDYKDNAFIQRAVPYTASNYYITGNINYKSFPTSQTKYYRDNNIIVSDLNVIEPPIEFNIPAKQKLKVRGGLQDIVVYTSYKTILDKFSPRTTNFDGIAKYFDGSLINTSAKDLPLEKISALDKTSDVQNTYTEILDNVFPRKDLVGLAIVRKRLNMKDVSGSFQYGDWSSDSFNRNTGLIRDFWKDDISDRKRTRGLDVAWDTGSINCIDSYNLSQSDSVNLTSTSSFRIKNNVNFGFYSYLGNNFYNSIYSMDCNVENKYSRLSEAPFYIKNVSYLLGSKEIIESGETFSQNNVYGDLSPLPHHEKVKFILSAEGGYNEGLNGYSFRFTAKPQFIYNNFFGYYTSSTENNKLYFYNNNSYQNYQDPNIKPYYNSYDDFFASLRVFSQNRSIIPEFTIEKNNSIINKQKDVSYISKYLTINRSSSFSSPSTNDNFTIDFNKFIDKKSNKIKIVFDGAKKLLPYNGFYPNQRSVQIIELFNNVFLKTSVTSLKEVEKQIAIEPLFAPGILFNTIKSGISVDYPVYTSTYPTDGGGNSVQSLKVFTAVTGGASYYVGYDNNDDKEYYSISSSAEDTKLNTRVPFEALLDPERYYLNSATNNGARDVNKVMRTLDPTHYSKVFLANSSSLYSAWGSATFNEYTPSLFLNRFNPAADNSYKFAINNFLAEIPNFFLTNGSLTTFTSAPQNKFVSLQNGSTYSMRVKIKQSDKFSMFDTVAKNSLTQPTHLSLFGPPIFSSSGTDYITPYDDRAYYPFAPPYMRRNSEMSEVILSYTANGTDNSLGNILANLSASHNIYNLGVVSAGALSGTMFLENCLNYKQIINDVTTTTNPTTGEVSTQVPDKTNPRWVIQPKFETPLINYTTSSCTTSSYSIGTIDLYNNAGAALAYDSNAYGVNVNINGIWNKYGYIPTGSEGIQISLDDVGFEDNSLLKAVGFQNEARNIGQLSDSKQISEAIVVIPYLEKNNVVNEKTSYDSYEDKYFFKISRQLISDLLGIKLETLDRYSIQDFKNYLFTSKTIDRKNSIIDLMTKMVTYNIPPHLNWLLKFSNSQPFVMYIAEFNHYLTKQDLADIWQNTMPSIAKNVELQTTSLEHVLDFNQLFEGIDLTSIDNMKGVVFKAKKRASNNYYDLTAQADDQPSNLRIPWYSYNWPYDYFSLVELVNIKAGEVYQPQVDVTQQAIKSIIQSGGKILDAGSKDITNSPQDLKNFLNNLGSNKNG